MIAIINTSDENNLTYGTGLQTYDVYINKSFLFRFEHKFEDGLAKCLEKASQAAKQYEKDFNFTLYMRLLGDFTIEKIGQRNCHEGTKNEDNI